MRNKKLSATKLVYIFAFALYVGCYFVSAYNRFEIFGIEYVALAALWFVGALDIVARRKGILNKTINYFSQCTNIIKMTCVLGGISLIFQLIHFHFNAALIKQVIFLAFPAITVMLICNTKEYLIEDYFNIVLIGAVVFFFAYFSKKLSWDLLNKLITQMNFLESYSPFEIGTTSIADIFFFCTVYFGHKKKYVRMGIAAVFGVLSFKRFIVIAIAICVLLSLIKAPKKRNGQRKLSKKIPRKLIWATIIIVLCIPLVMQALISDSAMRYLSDVVGMDINAFAKGRFRLMEYIMEVRPTNYGLGTIASYMSQSSKAAIVQAGNVHNDLFRLLYETTFLGLSTFVYYFVKNTNRDLKTFILTVFFLVNLAISNSLTNFMPVLLFNLLCCDFLINEKNTQQEMPRAA